MFEGLGERIQGVFKELRGEGHLTEYHLESALRQIRLSLLEADVALPVVKQFTARVKEQAVGSKVMQKLSPAQEVTRIVRDELIALLGGQIADLDLSGRPAVLALVGLQGSGKTTSAAKLALHLKIPRPLPASRRGRPLAPRGRLAVEDPRSADRRSRLRSRRRPRPGRGRRAKGSQKPD